MWCYGSSDTDLQSKRRVPIAFVVELFKITDIGLTLSPQGEQDEHPWVSRGCFEVVVSTPNDRFPAH